MLKNVENTILRERHFLKRDFITSVQSLQQRISLRNERNGFSFSLRTKNELNFTIKRIKVYNL